MCVARPALAGAPMPQCTQTEVHALGKPTWHIPAMRDWATVGLTHMCLCLCVCMCVTASTDDVLSIAGDYVAEALDKEKGAAVTDASIFRAHAAKYEVRDTHPHTHTHM